MSAVSVLRRIYYDAPNFWKADAAGLSSSDVGTAEADPNEGMRPSNNPRMAQLVSSEVKGQPGMHAPVIDLDFPAHLYPSRTPGHFHLWLDKPMTWREYKALLKALYKAGVIERGFYVMSVKRGKSFLRVPVVPGKRFYYGTTRPDLGETADRPEIELAF